MIKIYQRLVLLLHRLRHIEKAIATPLLLTTLGMLFASPLPFLSTLSSKLLRSCFPAHPLQPAWTAGSPPRAFWLCWWPSWLLTAGQGCHGLSPEVIPLLSILQWRQFFFISPTHCKPQTPRGPCSFLWKTQCKCIRLKGRSGASPSTPITLCVYSVLKYWHFWQRLHCICNIFGHVN